MEELSPKKGDSESTRGAISIKVTVICTVKNEGRSINAFLDSLLSQTRKPDEIVVVDGGSTDNTQATIESYIEKGAPIRLIISPGANVPQGRNIAIRNSENEVIASTDAGCVLSKEWLKEIVQPLEIDPSFDVVSGSYEYIGNTPFECAVVDITSPGIPPFDENFLPSSRSIAFKKGAWADVGGYPDNLRGGEDTYFDIALRDQGKRFALAKNALVMWRVRGDVQSLYAQYVHYRRWDAIAGLPGAKDGRMVVLGGIVALVAFLGLTYYSPLIAATAASFGIVYYFIRYGCLLYLKSKRKSILIYGPVVALTIIIGGMVGEISGTFRKSKYI